ncbi:unnamed protein product [Nyctereutes procyonoides]|uniref:(raccoon dog) hypothetical protein n=1 Tax=Nyctereutes procyonoides TaxID=34880 RepID=A0A811Y8A8_NYCPR|nr:unnamed protein product [Nyctereutes procyonoides]
MAEVGSPLVSPLAIWAVELRGIYFFFRFLFFCTCQIYHDQVYFRVSAKIHCAFSTQLLEARSCRGHLAHVPASPLREREREAETQAEGEAGSMHREPDVGFDPGSPGSRPGPKAGAKPLRHPGIPEPFFLKRERERERERARACKW